MAFGGLLCKRANLEDIWLHQVGWFDIKILLFPFVWVVEMCQELYLIKTIAFFPIASGLEGNMRAFGLRRCGERSQLASFNY